MVRITICETHEEQEELEEKLDEIRNDEKLCNQRKKELIDELLFNLLVLNKKDLTED